MSGSKDTHDERRGLNQVGAGCAATRVCVPCGRLLPTATRRRVRPTTAVCSGTAHPFGTVVVACLMAAATCGAAHTAPRARTLAACWSCATLPTWLTPACAVVCVCQCPCCETWRMCSPLPGDGVCRREADGPRASPGGAPAVPYGSLLLLPTWLAPCRCRTCSCRVV